MRVIQSRTRTQIRQSVGVNLADLILGSVTALPGGGADTTSLIDTIALHKGGDDEYNGRQVMIYDPAGTGTIVAGEKSWVDDFDGTTKDATVVAFTAAITVGDKYEMWKAFMVEDVNDAINQAILDVSAGCLQPKETHNTWTASGVYEYAWLSSFKGLYLVQYVDGVGTEVILHRCDVVWDELVDADVTATADTSFKKEGSASLKLVVAGGCAADDILAADAISSADLSGCDEIEVWIYSSVALNAGDLHLLLDNTASCATPSIETLDIPATTAATWTRHVISLANPHSDTAIISVGIEMEVDKGAFTLYVDDIKAVLSGSRNYKDLSPEYWEIIRGSTNYLKLSESGLSVVGSPTLIRLSGYQLPALFTDDTTDSEIDPAYLIAATTGNLLIAHAKSASLDINARAELAKFWLSKTAGMKSGIRTVYKPDIRWV